MVDSDCIVSQLIAIDIMWCLPGRNIYEGRELVIYYIYLRETHSSGAPVMRMMYIQCKLNILYFAISKSQNILYEKDVLPVIQEAHLFSNYFLLKSYGVP